MNHESARDALAIQDGACNPRAMARSLVRMIDAACDEGNGHPAAGQCPAVRLTLHQLLFILYGTDLYMSNDALPEDRRDWTADMAACRETCQQHYCAA